MSEALVMAAARDAPGNVFDDLLDLAGRIAGVPTAAVRLLDVHRHWFRDRAGLDFGDVGAQAAFGDRGVHEGLELEVSDTRKDPRFAARPPVTGVRSFVFYAGFPLITDRGVILGALCLLDERPHALSEDQRRDLRVLATQVMSQLELRRLAAVQRDELARHADADAEATAAATRRRSVQEELARSRGEYRLLAEHSSDIISRHSPQGLVTYVSPSMRSVLGFDPAAEVGKDARSRIHPDDRELLATALSAVADGQTRTVTIRSRHADGSWRWMETTLTPLVDPAGGDLLEVYSASRDVTDRIEATQALAASEERFRSVFSDSPVGIGLSDEHGHFVAANQALCRLFGRPESELLGNSSAPFTHPDDLAMHSQARTLIENSPDGSVRIEKRYVRPDGDIRWAWLTITHIDGPSGAPWTLAHVQDVTERKATEQSLADSEANLSAVAQVVRRIRTGENPRDSIVRAALQIAGAGTAALLEPAGDDTLMITSSAGLAMTGLCVPLDQPSVTAHAWSSGLPVFVPDTADDPRINHSLLEVSGARSAMWHPVLSHGTVIALLSVTWGDPVNDVSDRAARAVALLADESSIALEHDALLQRYADLATTDPLTDLPNRRAWDDGLVRMMAVAARSGEPLVVALADLDHFKVYNDLFGHAEGDALLSDLAAACRTELRAVDLFARWGGEEFALALPGCDETTALVVLNRIRAAMPRDQTLSLGYTRWRPSDTAATVLARADRAMYEAKDAGRNRIILAP